MDMQIACPRIVSEDFTIGGHRGTDDICWRNIEWFEPRYAVKVYGTKPRTVTPKLVNELYTPDDSIASPSALYSLLLALRHRLREKSMGLTSINSKSGLDASGREFELRVSEFHVRWRQHFSNKWNDLFGIRSSIVVYRNQDIGARAKISKFHAVGINKYMRFMSNPKLVFSIFCYFATDRSLSGHDSGLALINGTRFNQYADSHYREDNRRDAETERSYKRTLCPLELIGAIGILLSCVGIVGGIKLFNKADELVRQGLYGRANVYELAAWINCYGTPVLLLLAAFYALIAFPPMTIAHLLDRLAAF